MTPAETIPMLLTTLALLGSTALFLYKRGEASGEAAAKIKSAGESLSESAVRVSTIPIIENTVQAITSTMGRNHAETIGRLDKQDVQIAKLASGHSELKADMASLEAGLLRKVSYRDLRTPSRTDWDVETGEEKP